MSKRFYLISIIFCVLYGTYFLVTKQWTGGLLLLGVSLPINIKGFIRELKDKKECEE